MLHIVMPGQAMVQLESIREVFSAFIDGEKGWLCCIDHFGFELRFGKSHTGKNHLLRRYWNPPAASPQGQPSRGLFHRVTLPALPETVSLWGISHHQAVIPWVIPIFSWLNHVEPISGWWFGTFFLFFQILGRIIPTDKLIFLRGVGWNHQPDMYIYIYI